MKLLSRILIVICSLTLTTSLLMASTGEQAETVVHFAFDPSPPFVNFDPQGRVTDGIVVDLLQLVFKHIPDARAELHIMPWRRALAEVTAGRIDAMPGVAISSESQDSYVLSNPFLEMDLHLFYNRQYMPKPVVWKGMEDLMDSRIGIVRGDDAARHFILAKRSGLRLNLTQITTEKALFRMLAAGRIDLVASHKIAWRYYQKSLQLGQSFNIIEGKVSTERYSMAFSKNSSALPLIPSINRALKTMVQDGTIEALFSDKN